MTTTTTHPADLAIVDAFIEHVVDVLGQTRTSGANHRRRLVQFLAWCREHDLDHRALTEQGVLSYVAHGRRRGLGPATIATALGTLRLFYDLQHPPEQNPARRVPMPRRDPTDLPPYRPREAARILASMRAEDSVGVGFDRAFMEVLASTGVRRCEAVAAHTADVDLDGGLFQVRDDHGVQRVVPLPAATVEVLAGYLQRIRPVCPTSERLFANPRASFDSDDYGTFHESAAGALARRVGRRSGVAGPHTCRRWRVTYTVELLRTGMPLEDVASRVGHRMLEVTARYQRFLDGI